MAHSNCQRLREQIITFMYDIPIPSINMDEIRCRVDGVNEFNKYWQVHGTYQNGISASFVDCDDIIEFGLLERNGTESINLLHATVILDEDSDQAELNCISEYDSEMNFNTTISPDKSKYLNIALCTFAELTKNNDV